MKKQLIVLNVLAILLFVGCWIVLGFELNEATMFSTNDSVSYLEVADWIFKGQETDATLVRPVLYPILMGVPHLIFGVVGVWLLQFAGWLVTVNLTFLSAKKWSESYLIGWIAAFIIILNLSFIALTFHGLTEVVTTALLSVMCYHVVSYSKRFDERRFGVKLLVIFVLLTLVKPAFLYPTLFCLIAILIGYRKHYRLSPKKLLFPILVILPILLQMTIVQTRHGDFTVSKIGGITFKNYYFAQCVRIIENVDERESKEFANGMSSDERLDYILENKGVFVKQFVENVVLNIKSESAFLEKGQVNYSNLASPYMLNYNRFSLLVHLLGTFLLGVLFLRAFFRRKKEIWIPLLCIGGLSSYFLFTTGLSFWQGDRLVLPAIALWVPLYVVLFYQVGSNLLARLRR